MKRTATAVAGPLGSALPALAVALLPKCPACLGAYLAMGSGLGLGGVSPGVMSAVLIGVLGLALALLGRAAARRKLWGAFAVACVGAAIVVAGRALDAGRIAGFTGVALLYAGALWIYISRLRRTEKACHST